MGMVLCSLLRRHISTLVRYLLGPRCASRGSLDADALSGACRAESACARERGRDHLCFDARTVLAKPGKSSVRGSSPTWAPSTFDPVAACLWSDGALATPQ